MSDDTILPFGFPAIGRKKLIAAFDGGRITTDGGVLLLGAVERQLGIAAKMARLIADPRNPASLFSGSGVVALEGQRRGKVSDRIDVQHLGADAAIEGLDHTIGLWRTRLGVAILRAQFGAGFGKGLG